MSLSASLVDEVLSKALAHLRAASLSANAAVPVVSAQVATGLHVAVAHAAIRLLEVSE